MLTTPDGSRIAVHDFGGTGRHLLLVHATGLHGWVFGELASHLPGFHCLALDLRGHGESIAADGWDGSWLGFAEDVLTVVEGFGLDQPLVFGHSCGGATALLAEEARPGTFSAIYAFEPIVRPFLHSLPPSLDNPMSQGALRRRATFPSRLDALLNFSSKPPLDALSPASLRAYVEHGFVDGGDGEVHLACPREVEAKVFAQSVAHDAFKDLPAIACSVRLACGGLSDGYGEPVVRSLAARLALGPGDPEVRVFEKLGHFGPLQRPDEVADDLAAFAAR